MGKKKAKVNKSRAIREYLAANPQATPNEIVEGLKQQGIAVSPGLASNVKYTSAQKTPGRRGRPKGRRVAKYGNGALTAADLLQAKRLVDQLGGLEQVQRALATLEELR